MSFVVLDSNEECNGKQNYRVSKPIISNMLKSYFQCESIFLELDIRKPAYVDFEEINIPVWCSKYNIYRNDLSTL